MSIYLLGCQWHDTFSILTLVQVSQLHDLYHVDESPWKLQKVEGWASVVPRHLWGSRAYCWKEVEGSSKVYFPLPNFTNKLRPREGTCLILSHGMVFIGPTL